MNDDVDARVLARCLDRVAGGATIAACLADYPQHADELAPLLTAAAEIGALRGYRVSDAARQRMRARLLQAELVQRERTAARGWLPWSGLAIPRLAAGFSVALVCAVLTTGMVAASHPGDLAYGVRIAVERLPVMLARSPEQRARAELGLADHRLSDLDRNRVSQGEEPDERAVAALVDSAERAAVLSASLTAEVRGEISAALREQAGHLAELGASELSDTSRIALQTAVARVGRAAERAEPPAWPIEPSASPAPTATATRAPTATPTALPAVYPSTTAEPTRKPTANVEPHATHTVTPPHSRLEPSATPKRLEPSVTPRGPGPNATPPVPGPTVTPKGPEPNATPQGQGTSATPQGPGPSSTPRGPNPSATPQGPGASATPKGPTPAATSINIGPTGTPRGPGPDATSQGPGPSATAQRRGSGSGNGG